MSKQEWLKTIRVICLLLIIIAAAKAAIEIYAIHNQQPLARFTEWYAKPQEPGDLKAIIIGPQELPNYKDILPFILIWLVVWLLAVITVDILKPQEKHQTSLFVIIVLMFGAAYAATSVYLTFPWLILGSAVLLYILILAIRIYVWPVIISITPEKQPKLINHLIIGLVVPWVMVFGFMVVATCSLPCFINFPDILALQVIVIGVEHIGVLILACVIFLPKIQEMDRSSFTGLLKYVLPKQGKIILPLF